ncbi:FxSxx-COOH system tetratricopeptide repeat protein, partial [Blastopirellula marina]
MPGEQQRKIFISGTSHDLQSYRAAVVQWALAKGHLPVEQADFEVQPDYLTIVQMLRDKLSPCDAVIHLAGFWYGGEPTNRPDGEHRRSYTQLEYELGSVLQRQTFRFIARENYQPDRPLEGQDAELAELQIQHRQRLTLGSEPWSANSRTTGNELYYEFSTPEELVSLLDMLTIHDTTSKPINLPYQSLGSLFKGRDEFLAQLRRVLINKPTHIAAVTGRHAIHGLGGVGKTRAAVEYAWQQAHEYSALLFIKADSPQDLERNLAGLCGALVLNLPERDSRELETQVAAAVRWLREHAGWLLIVDNVDTEEAQAAVEQRLAAISTGHVVITSRLTHWEGAVEPLDLDVLPHDAAASFLLERTAGRRQPQPSDPDDAEALANDLDSLALALEQAGAYIVRTGISLARYRERWAEQDHRVLQWFNENLMKYPRSVATTWETSLAELSEDARTLLNILSWLAPDPIPRFLLEQLEEIEDAPELDLDAALGDLTTYSLARWQDERTGIEIHRLVQEITRWRLDAEREPSFLAALRMVNAALIGNPQDVRTWPIYRVLQPHAAGVTDFAQPFHNPEPTSRILNQLGLYLDTRAEYHSAEPLFRRALEIYEASYGPDHPMVAAVLNNLAGLLHATNRLSEAEPLFRRALAIDEASYGPDHPMVAAVLNNLAGLLHATNRPSEAEPLFRRALEISEGSNGPDHPTVAIRLNNLAALLWATNRLSEAEPLYRRALEIDEASYGPDHPAVARDLNNLAELLRATNRLNEAEPLFRRALEINEASYGPEHPTVAIRLNNLALLLRATNRLNEAEPLFRRALEIDEASYGPDHPDVARDLNNLASLLRATNRLNEAEPLYRRALEIDEASYGPDHPAVA